MVPPGGHGDYSENDQIKVNQEEYSTTKPNKVTVQNNLNNRRGKNEYKQEDRNNCGVLYIIGTVAGVLSVVFTGPIRNAPDYFINLPANESQLVIGALFVLIMGLALAMVPVMMFPLSRKHNEALALGYVVFRGALETVTYMATVINWLLLLTLGQVYGQAGAQDASNFQALVALVLEGKAMSSITTIVFILGALMFYYLLYQSKLIPRWISGWGLIAAIPYLAAGLLVMFGLIGHMAAIDAVLRLPLGVQEMVLAVWLIVKGFNPSAITSGSARTDMDDA